MARIALPKPALEIADLELVLALGEAGSTVRAAEALHLTQSAVSRGLVAVEGKLGAKLFERGPRGLCPTPVGERLIAGAGAVLSQLVELEHHARTGRIAEMPLRIVCECYTAYRWLPGALLGLSSSSGASIHVAIEHTRAPVEALLAGEVDVALLTTSRVPRPLVEAPLFSDEIVFVLAATHPLAGRAAIHREDLEVNPFITSSATPEAERRWFAREVFGRSAPRLQHLELPLTEAVIDAARAGLGIAAMSEWVARPYVAAGDLVAKPHGRKRLRRPWRIAYRAEAAQGAQRLAAALAGAPPRLFVAQGAASAR